MRDYFMVSECNGDLFDTRKTGWHKKPPLRANYDSYIQCEHCNKTIVEDWQEEEEEK